MSKNAKAGRAIRKMNKAGSAAEAQKILQGLDPKTKRQVQK
jgi:hypothetical protein